jgi:TM2 domain-containing membrane protein YozV
MTKLTLYFRKRFHTKWLVSFTVFLVVATHSCYRVPENIEPKIDYAIQDRYLLDLPSPFPPLTAEEWQQDWAKEYRIAMGFAHQLDLYQAITAFKRAEFLVPPESRSRKLEIDYEILLCYYLGRKYPDVIDTFEHTDLHFVDPSFPAFHDLLVILYDSYNQANEPKKAAQTLDYIRAYYPETAEKLALSSSLQKADLPEIKAYAAKSEYAYLNDLLSAYEKDKKSITKAQTLNAIVPGAGYLYLGQKQSALTALLLNGLFIGATYYFFHHGNVPAGVIFASFEAGWYFGGIYGAGEEAKFYNERVYERYATPMMNQKGLFPGFMIQYAF